MTNDGWPDSWAELYSNEVIGRDLIEAGYAAFRGRSELMTLDEQFDRQYPDHGLAQENRARAKSWWLAGASAEREACAQVCEDTVTFTEDHLNRDGLDPCGWCVGLETAADRIRQRSASPEAEAGK